MRSQGKSDLRQAKKNAHDISQLAASDDEDWVPISPAGTEGCLWDEDNFDYEALMKNVPQGR